MASTNIATKHRKAALVTHEGAPAVAIDPEAQLRRSVMACLLWEKEFYEDGVAIADRITETAALVPPATLAAIAVEARNEMHLRHVPLLLLNVLTKTGKGLSLVSETFPKVIQRADELGEFMAIYWKDGKHPISAQAKRGLAASFANFDAYQMAKYRTDAKVRLRDVMFLTHPKPAEDRAPLYTALADDVVPPANTWEVALSAGADKKATFESLLRENKLGYLALLRNLRLMDANGVDTSLIEQAIENRRGASRVLPFRFVAAVNAAPHFANALSAALSASIEALPELPGTTIVLVDVSGSMEDALSKRSDMKRIDAAAALATFVRSQRKRVFSFSNDTKEVPDYPGLSGIGAIKSSQPHGGTYLGGAVEKVNRLPHDRLIVITDEQSHDRVERPNAKHAYMINVASARNGVGYGDNWTHLDGFSERVLNYIAAVEGFNAPDTDGEDEGSPEGQG